MFISIWDWIYYGKDTLCLQETGSKLEQYCSIWDHLHKGTHFGARITDAIHTGSTV